MENSGVTDESILTLQKEELLNLLFPHGVPEDCKVDGFIEYLDSLGTKTVSDIGNELISLKGEYPIIIKRSKETAVKYYKTFVETHQCSGKILEKLNTAESKLSSLTECISKLMLLENLTDRLNEIKTERINNNSLLKYETYIIQLLELPALISDCIKHSRYEEVFKLINSISDLADRYPNIPIIKCVKKDIDKLWWEMMNHLLIQLQNDIQLPTCLQVIGYLRRMNIFSETELRLQFLITRNSWLEKILCNIPTDDYNYHLNKTIELSRVNIFNIVTEYKAVFSEDEVVGRQDDPKSSFFHMWLSKKINDFVRTVERDIPYCSSNSMDSIYGQCMYFGLSFGRIGADFRGLIQSIFVRSIEMNFRTALENADVKLQKAMETFILPKDDSIINIIPTLKEEMESSDTAAPPVSLLEFHPIANYCNDIITAFNGLRLCAPWNVLATVTSSLQQSLKNTSLTLLNFYKREKHTFYTNDRETFGRLCESFAKSFLPYIQNCLHVIFKPADIALFYSLPISELEKQGIGYLDIPDILNAINDILLTLQVVADSVV